jgi:hypothetical protein
MPIKFLNHVSLEGAELQKARVESLAEAPTAVAGRIYFDTELGYTRVYDGAAWLRLDDTQAISDAAAAQGDATQALTDAATAQSAADAAQGDATQALTDAATAQSAADAAQGDATQALTDAATAQSAADAAQSAADAAQGDATQALTDAATAQSAADAAQGDATQALTDAATAQSAADAAQGDATQALTDAATAQSAADAAQGDATQALTDAATAQSAADAAQGDATQALTDAATAQSAADAAQGDATQALTDAATAQSAADAAQGDATQALTDAATAQSAADAAQGDVDALDGRVGALETGVSWKQSVRATTTENITLSGEQSVDGIYVVDGDRVLVKNQTNQTENTIYVVVDGDSWTPATDADSFAKVKGAAVFVEEGQTFQNSVFVLASDLDAPARQVADSTDSHVFADDGETSYAFLSEIDGTGSSQIKVAGTVTSDEDVVLVMRTFGADGNWYIAESATILAGTAVAVDVDFSPEDLVPETSGSLVFGPTFQNQGFDLNIKLATETTGTTSWVLAVTDETGPEGEIAWVKMAALSDIQAGSGLIKEGATLRVAADYTTIEIGNSGLAVMDAGITAAKLAEDAVDLATNVITGVLPAANGGALRYAETIGDDSATSFAVVHNFDSTDVVVTVKEIATGDLVIADVVVTDADTVTVSFLTAPDTDTYRVVVLA